MSRKITDIRLEVPVLMVNWRARRDESDQTVVVTVGGTVV